MPHTGLMLGYQHQVGSRTAKMLMLPSLLFQALLLKVQKVYHASARIFNVINIVVLLAALGPHGTRF